MVEHRIKITDWWHILKEGKFPTNWEYKTVAEFIFWALWVVMKIWYTLVIKSAALNWKRIDPKNTLLPNRSSDVAAIMESGPKASK